MITGQSLRRWFGLVLVATSAAGPGGCSDRLLRENVFANTETMVGVQLAQNAQTQMYELKAGFVRHELFLVPTGKRVVYNADGEVVPTDDTITNGQVTARKTASGENAADRTPEVLGEIMVDGALPFAPGQGGNPPRVGVYQRLAVGKLAVAQPAAIALFARDSATAKAAVEALTMASVDTSLDDLTKQSKGLKFLIKSGDQTKEVDWPEAANAWSKELGSDDYPAIYESQDPAKIDKLVKRWKAELAAAKARAGK